MGLISWINKRVENNAPAVAGGLAYGGAYINPFLSKQDADNAAAGASQLTQKALNGTAPLRTVVAASTDKLAFEAAKGAVHLADTATGGLVAPPVKRAYADAQAIYDKASTLAPILTLDNKSKSYNSDLLAGNEKFNIATVRANPISHEVFLQRLGALGLDAKNSPQTGRLVESLKANGNFLETEGYASVLELARSKGGKGLEELTGKLNGSLDKGHKPLEFRRQVAASGLRDVAFPTTIEQGPKSNCGGIAIQQMWAREHPGTYLDALTSLAEDRGHRFSNGQVMSPLNDGLKNKDDGRDVSVKVMGDAISRYAHERSLLRQGGLEVAGDASQRWLGRGLGPTPFDNYHPDKQPYGIHNVPEVADVLGDITGHKYGWRVNDALGKGLQEVDRGKPVATLISGKVDKEWHWVQMTGRSGSNVNISSWGNEYSVAGSKLNPFLRAVLVDEGPAR